MKIQPGRNWDKRWYDKKPEAIRRQRAVVCEKKTAHATRASADAAARTSWEVWATRLTPYECVICRHWHLTKED